MLPLQSFAPNTTRVGEASGSAQLRRHGRGLGGAGSPRPAARGAPGPDQGAAGRVRAGRAAVLRHVQHPLHHGHAHRDLGRRTSSTASACCRRATSRSCGTSARPRATTSSTTRGWATAARRAGISTMRGAMSPESGRAEDVAAKIRVELEQRGLLVRAGGHRRDRAAGAVRAPARGDRGRRRPAAHAAGAGDQDPGRDHAAQHGLRDGRRRLRGAVPHDARRHPRERLRRAGQQACSTRWARSSSRASTRSRASAAAPIRTCSPTARCAPATRPTSTSCTATWATARATTARSRWPARRGR